MRRAPNSGSVYKLSGKRRKPWVATITVGWERKENDVTQKRILVGTFPTKSEAQAALEAYNVNPYDLRKACNTFAEVYDQWSREHFEKIVQSAQRTWISAFRYFAPIHNIPIREITAGQYELVIANANVGDATKMRMKSMLNLMYKFALKHEIVDKDISRLVEVTRKAKKSEKHKSFTDDQIACLWANMELPWVPMIIVGIYSGWRPQELATLLSENVYDIYMVGGSKTDAGRDRIVPIHPSIKPIMAEWKNRSELIGAETVFFDQGSQTGKCMTYDKYRKRFDKVMKYFGWNNTPHDTRHTFITLGKRYGMSEGALKNIIGHSTGDLTEDIYTHRNVDDLMEEIRKIKAPEP